MLQLRKAGFWFEGAEPLFSGVDAEFPSGVWGLVGPNGSGKSTLLRALAGSLQLCAGERSGATGAEVAWCDQRVDEPGADVLRLAQAYDRRALRWQKRLGLEPALLDRWESASPGERRRWQLAGALYREPDLLLVDELSNHLDAASRRQIESALRGFRGVAVLVSHDRELLDSLCQGVMWLEAGQLNQYPGGYTQAAEIRAQELASREHGRQCLRAEHAELTRRVQREREAANQAARGISARTRMKSRKDNDARGALRKGLAERAAATLSSKVGASDSQLRRVSEQLERARVEKRHGRSVFVDYQRAPKSRLLQLTTPRVERGNTLLVEDVSVVVERESRIWLRGPNGSGKSTLIAELLATSQLPGERVLHLAQDQNQRTATASVEAMRQLPLAERGRVLELVAALGTNPEQLLSTARPSPGEAQKLQIALGLSRGVWLVILDEPTNHLDLPSVERLESALAAYPGALVLATHDERFAQATCNEAWSLGGGRIERASLLGGNSVEAQV